MDNYILCKHCDTKVKYTDRQVKTSTDCYSVYNLDGSFAGTRHPCYIYCPKCDEKIIVAYEFTEWP